IELRAQPITPICALPVVSELIELIRKGVQCEGVAVVEEGIITRDVAAGSGSVWTESVSGSRTRSAAEGIAGRIALCATDAGHAISSCLLGLAAVIGDRIADLIQQHCDFLLS